MTEKLVTVPCKITRGGFSGERVIRMISAEGVAHTGVVPRHYCYHPDKRQIGKDEPAPGKEIEGKLVARIVREESDGRVSVYLPDGEVVAVKAKQITEFQGVSPHVPVES